jgi:hypothetical protein
MASRKSNLIKVLNKLYGLHSDGADFAETRWRFDWDTEQGAAPNIVSCTEELLALTTLSQVGVIDMVKRTTDNGRTPYSATEFNWLTQDVFSLDPSTDYASQRYTWAVWLTGFNYQEFRRRCAALGFDPETRGAPAQLSFTSISVPTVSLEGSEYLLNPLSEGGKPFNIVSYCLTKPGELVPLDELRRQSGLTTVTNINQALKRSYFDRNNGLLRYFVRATPGGIKVTPSITLTDYAKQQLIQNARQS